MKNNCYDIVYFYDLSHKFFYNVETIRDINTEYVEVGFAGGSTRLYLRRFLKSYEYSHSEKSDSVTLRLIDNGKTYFPKEVRIYGKNEVYGSIDSEGNEYLYHADDVALRKMFNTECCPLKVFSYLRELSVLKSKDSR